MATPMRRQRVAEQIRQELSSIIQHDIRDPRKGWVTVTRVEMSSDLCYARVFISILGDEEAQQASWAVLERAVAYMRGELGRRIRRLRQIPELQLKHDDSLEHSQRVMDILRDTPIPPESEES